MGPSPPARVQILHSDMDTIIKNDALNIIVKAIDLHRNNRREAGRYIAV